MLNEYKTKQLVLRKVLPEKLKVLEEQYCLLTKGTTENIDKECYLQLIGSGDIVLMHPFRMYVIGYLKGLKEQ